MQKVWIKFKRFWQNRANLNEKRHQQRDALNFLPSALQIQEHPPHPVARVMMWILVSIIVFTLLWACIGKMDVIVTAQGKIVPQAQVKIIQPLEKGIVKAIYVKDGQLVMKEELLLELDQSVTQTDIENLAHQLKVAQLMLAQHQTVYNLLTSHEFIEMRFDEVLIQSHGFSEMEQESLKQLVWRKWQVYVAEINRLEANVNVAKAELNAAQEQIKMLTQTVPIIREQNKMYHALHQSDFASKAEYLQSQKDLIEKEQLLAQSNATYAQLQANLASHISELKRVKADYFAQSLESIEMAKKDVNILSKELTKYELMQREQSLKAPITGYIHNLAVHTLGAVVTSAQMLMQIIPKASPLEVNATIPNKDIGYLHEGQKVRIKVDTYPFTEYGFLTGKILEITDDAIEDERLGLVFKIMVSLDQNTLQKGNSSFAIRPGMSVIVEVKTHERRIIEYFLSPLVKAFKESLHER